MPKGNSKRLKPDSANAKPDATAKSGSNIKADLNGDVEKAKNLKEDLKVESKGLVRSNSKSCVDNSDMHVKGTDSHAVSGLQKRKLDMAPPPFPSRRQRCSLQVPRSVGIESVEFKGFAAKQGPSWWTPRVQLALTFAANFGVTLLRHQAECFENGRPGRVFWGSQHLPPCIQEQGVHKSFLRGMAELARIADIVNRNAEPPLASVVMQVVSPLSSFRGDLGIEEQNRHSLSHFFGKGGQPAHVLSAIVDEAEIFSKACTREDLSESTESAGQELSRSDWASCYRSLPQNDADRHFDSLRKRLCGALAGEVS